MADTSGGAIPDWDQLWGQILGLRRVWLVLGVLLVAGGLVVLLQQPGVGATLATIGLVLLGLAWAGRGSSV